MSFHLSHLVCRILQRRRTTPVLHAIYIADAAGSAMRCVTSINAIAQLGLQGDRYSRQRGHWRKTDACQVTLLSSTDLAKAKSRGEEKLRGALAAGAHRRNLVIARLDTRGLPAHCQIHIGTAVFRYQQPRPPCAYIDSIAGQGMSKALGRNSGICLEVIESGRLQVGDAVQIHLPGDQDC